MPLDSADPISLKLVDVHLCRFTSSTVYWPRNPKPNTKDAQCFKLLLSFQQISMLLHFSMGLRTEKFPHTSTVSLIHLNEYCAQTDNLLSNGESINLFHVHLSQTVQERPFQCDQCPAAFARKPYLDIHARTHTGERPFECDVCLKRFTQKSSLNIHKSIHSG